MRGIVINAVVAICTFLLSWWIFRGFPTTERNTESLNLPTTTLLQEGRSGSSEEKAAPLAKGRSQERPQDTQGKVTVDRAALQLLLTDVSDARNAFQGAFGDLIGVTSEQLERYEKTLSDTEDKLRELEEDNFSITEDGGNKWITIKPFEQAGKQLKAEFQSEIENIFGAEVGDLAWNRIKNSDSLGHFGNLETRLSLISEPNTITGESVEYLEIEFYGTDGRHLSGSRSPLENNPLMERYLHVFPDRSSQ